MIQVIERFHCILEKVAGANGQAVKSTDLASMLSISAPACANILRTMVKLEYLKKGYSRGEYLLGNNIERFSKTDDTIQRLLETASPLIHQLANDTGEFVVMVNEKLGLRHELVKVQGQNSIQVNFSESHQYENLINTATGLVLLSFRSPESRKLYFQNHFVANNIIKAKNVDELEAACREVRANESFFQGQILEEMESYPIDGCAIMAFPVWFEKQVVAAMGLRIPLFRYTRSHRDNIIAKCREVLNQIKSELQ